MADAVSVLEQLSKNPESYGVARIRIAGIRHATGRVTEAHAVLADLLKRNPNNAEALAMEARLLLIERRVDDALAKAKAAIQADPNSDDAQFILGRTYIVRKEYEPARRAFNEARALNPGRLDADIELSRLHIERREIDTAVQIARDSLNKYPNRVEARVALIDALIVRSEDHPQAFAQVQRLVKDYPESPAAHVEFGKFHLAVKDPAAARKDFERALALDDSYLEALGHLVSLDMVSGKTNDARQRLFEHLTKRPDDPGLLMMSAKVAMARHELPQAERVLRRLIERDPTNLEAYDMLGRVYIQAKRLPAATREFNAIVQRDPNSSSAHTMLGLLYHAQRKVPEAIDHYDKAFESDPHSATAANNLAWVLAENDTNLDRALQLAQAAKAQLPNEPIVIDTLGWVYYKQGILPLATTTLEEAVRLNPNAALYSYHLGVVHAKAGEDAKARKALERAIQLDSKSAFAADAQKTLAALVY